jgi:hypothetical protein
MDGNKELLTIRVNQQQKDAICQLFEEHSWILDVVEERIENDTGEQEDHQHDVNEDLNNREIDAQLNDVGLPHELLNLQDGEANDNVVPENNPGPVIQPVPGQEECPHCFCQPCVTTNRQHWLGRGQAARAGNNLVRKQKYKRFWKMMADRGAWMDPRYLAKKRRAQGAGLDAVENDAWLPSVREILPDCVINLVRDLYPNPPGIPYMGHKWH